MLFEDPQGAPSPVTYDRCLRIRGAGEREISIAFEDCQLFAQEHQVQDVGELVPNRRGRALRFSGLLASLPPAPRARFGVLTTADGSLLQSVALPLDELREHGLLVYAWDGKPLSYWHGGPFHLILPERPYGSSDLPHLFRLALSEAPVVAEARASEPKARVEPATDGIFYRAAFSDPRLHGAVLA